MNRTITTRLKNMIFYAYHGVFSEEKEQGQRFEVDLDFCFEVNAELWKDELKETISYVEIYELVQKIVQEEPVFDLLESLGNQIISSIQNEISVQNIVVKIRKPAVRIQGLLDYVEVEVAWTKPAVLK